MCFSLSLSFPVADRLAIVVFFFFASFSILDVGMNCCLWLFIVDIVVVFFPFSYAVVWIFFSTIFFFRSLARSLIFFLSWTQSHRIARLYDIEMADWLFFCAFIWAILFHRFESLFIYLFSDYRSELQFVHRLNLLAFHYCFNEIWPSLSMFHTTGT